MVSSRFSVWISASSIQNSLRCRGVSLFSARKVGDRDHTFLCSCTKASRWSWEDTVKYFGARKKSLLCLTGLSGLGLSPPLGPDTGGDTGDAAVTVNTSPAPSQSDEVNIGGCSRTNSRSRKNLERWKSHSDLSRASNAFSGIRNLRCGMVRRYSGEWYFFWMG